MTTEYLEKQLENWQRLLLITLGAVAIFLADSLADLPNHAHSQFPGWFGIWLLLQLGTTPTGLMLLLGKAWRALPLTRRLNTAFGYCGMAWIVLLTLGVRLVTIDPELLTGVSFLVLSLGFSLGAAYFYLRRTHSPAPEELFP